MLRLTLSRLIDPLWVHWFFYDLTYPTHTRKTMFGARQDQIGRISVLFGDFASSPYREGLFRILSRYAEFDVSVADRIDAAEAAARDGQPTVFIVEGSDPSLFLDRLQGNPRLSVVVLDAVGGRAHIGLENPGSSRLVEIIKASAVVDSSDSDTPPQRRVRLISARELSDRPSSVAKRGGLAPLIEWLDLRFSSLLAELADHEAGGIPGWSVSPREALRLLGDSSEAQSSERIAARLELVDGALIERRTTLPGPLCEIATGFSLSATELRILCLVLAPELDGRYGIAVGVLQDDLTRRRPGLTLLAQLLGEEGLAYDLRRLLDSSESVRSKGLVGPTKTFESAVDVGYLPSAAVTAHILGSMTDAPDLGLGVSFHRPVSNLILTAAEEAVANRIRSLWEYKNPPVCRLRAGDPQKAWFARICRGSHVPLIQVDVRFGDLSDAPAKAVVDWSVLSGIHNAGLLVTGVDTLDGAEQGRVLVALSEVSSQVGLVATDAEPGRFDGTVRSLAIHAPISSMVDRARLWRDAAESNGLSLSHAEARRLASVIRVHEAGIGDLLGLSAFGMPALDDCDLVDRVQQVARGNASRSLPPAVQSVEVAYTWDDIVVPEAVEQALRTISVHVLQAGTVLEEWGFSNRLPYGIGVAALFSGPSGTGKTMAAQIIAGDLGVQLFHVDLSKTISKYIGETEKNLEQVFSAAEDAGAVLLFDEADALFGKRTEVKDAHDRHANVEVAYLLQRIESFRGLAILTSNLKQNIDQAFMRRLRFVVDFPLPSVAEREAIWKRCFPDEAPVSPDLDVAFLARRLSLTGGSIQQIVLHAAFGAADADEPIGMSHIVSATRRELIKIGMLSAEKTLDELAA